MGSNNNGGQIFSFDYKQRATSRGFNKYALNTTSPGLYFGGEVSLSIDGERWELAPFTVAVRSIDKDNRPILVNVTTDSVATVAAKSGGQYPLLGEELKIVTKLDWQDVQNSFLDFAVNGIDSFLTNEIIFCKLIGTGALTPPIVSYDFTTYGHTYIGRDVIPSSNGRQFYASGTYYLSRFQKYNGSLNVALFQAVFPKGFYKMEMLDVENPKDKIIVTYQYDATNPQLHVEYTSGYPIRITDTYVDGFLFLHLNAQGELIIRNELATTKQYYTKIERNAFREVIGA
jgi:hypothetical protein